MRKKISTELKAKVAIEAVKGIKTISEIASIYQIHPNQVSQWKKQFLKSTVGAFSKSVLTEDTQKEKEMDNLYRKIGQLEIENEFLEKSGISYRFVNSTPEDDRVRLSRIKYHSAVYYWD